MNKYSNTLNFRTLNDIVYDAIKLKITNLVYLPGEQLVEQRIADELGVSKSPIREAFRRLDELLGVHSSERIVRPVLRGSDDGRGKTGRLSQPGAEPFDARAGPLGVGVPGGT